MEEEERGLVLQAVGEELWGWGASSSSALANIEHDVLELDTSHAGTVHQSQLTYVFLRNEVPLKLPTLGRLLQLFSKETCPDEVFLQRSFAIGLCSQTHFYGPLVSDLVNY